MSPAHLFVVFFLKHFCTKAHWLGHRTICCPEAWRLGTGRSSPVRWLGCLMVCFLAGRCPKGAPATALPFVSLLGWFVWLQLGFALFRQTMWLGLTLALLLLLLCCRLCCCFATCCHCWCGLCCSHLSRFLCSLMCFWGLFSFLVYFFHLFC